MSVSDHKEIPHRLKEHLDLWLGDWSPPDSGLRIVSSPNRQLPGWDGAIHEVVGVARPDSGVLSLPEPIRAEAERLVTGLSLTEALAALGDRSGGLGALLGRTGRMGQGRFRWSDSPTPGADVGEWVPTHDPRVPEWLRPFNGDLLIAWDDNGAYGAGVGRKQHDRIGHELSVGTEESLRGRGLGRLLVATVARRVRGDGAIPTYLHAFDNHASSKVADAAGFPDRGWTVLGFWG